MARLIVVRLFVGIWRRAIALSDKLQTRVWNALVVTSIILLCLSMTGVFHFWPQKKSITSRLTAEVYPRRNSVPDSSRYALVIGINDYSGSIPKNNISDDVESMANELEKFFGRAQVKPYVIEKKIGEVSGNISGCQVLHFATHGVLSEENPNKQGIWPAFWILGNDIGSFDWPICGEIDSMENLGGVAGSQLSVRMRNQYATGSCAVPYNWLPAVQVEGTKQLVSDSAQPPFRDTLFWVSLFATVANTLGTISTITLAWISNRRFQAELMLKKAEMALKQREMELKEAEAKLKMKELELKLVQLEQELTKASPKIITAT